MATFWGRLGADRRILVLGFSEAVSNVGNWITMMAVFALVIFRGNGSVVQSSAIMMAGLLPLLVASPLAGWLCDRYDRRLLMVASELASAVLVSLLVFSMSPAVIYPVLTLEAIAGSVMTPARRSVVPALVAAERLPRVNAFFQQLNGITKIGAPLLAGGILALIAPRTAILLDVATFLVSAFLLSRLPKLRPAGSAKPDSITKPVDRLCENSVRTTSCLFRKAGNPLSRCQADTWFLSINRLRYTTKTATVRRTRLARHADPAKKHPPSGIRALIWGSVGLRLIFATAFLGIVVVVGFDVLASVFVRDALHAGEGLFGVLVSLIGIGTVGISIVIMARRKRRDPWTDVVFGILLLSAIPLSFSLTSLVPVGLPRIMVALVGCLIGGAGNGLLNVQAGTLLQLLSPSPLLGRVSGAYQSTAAAGQLLGVLLTPVLVPAALTMGLFFLVSFAALLLLMLWVLFNLRAARARGAGGSGARKPRLGVVGEV